MPAERRQLRQRLVAIAISLVVGAVLMGAKFYAWRLTRSSAILSDALESIINVAASAFALVSILIAARPPDEGHPYGHGKIEFFSAGFEGALIVLAALGIFKTGLERLLHPQALARLDTGLLMLAGAGIVNLILGTGLIRVGRRTSSLVLEADGRHVLTDVFTTAGVLLGLILVRFTGWTWLDGATACAVGLQILWTGGSLVRTSFSGLMDERDPALLEKVSRLLVAHRQPSWIDIHQLRALRAGSLTHIDFHLILPRNLSLEAAHREGKVLEQAIITAFDAQASVLIHLDPCQDSDCPVCRQHACQMRTGEPRELPAWDWRRLTQSGNGPWQD